MSELDQFESVFRSAVRSPYIYEKMDVKKVLVVTDLDTQKGEALLDTVRQFLSAIERDALEWKLITRDQFSLTSELLQIVEAEQADLICTYRNLQSLAWQFPHSLGEYVDVLLQLTPTPVMILPHPDAGFASEHAMLRTTKVMALTDHLDQDHRLVNSALHFTQDQGSLFLVHIEDQNYFDRIVDALSKISTIETESACWALKQQLLKQPRQYIESCRQILLEKFPSIKVEEILGFGHRIKEFKQYIEQYEIDLLAMNTKDDDQLAMHGMAYPLAIELRQIPLLML